MHLAFSSDNNYIPYLKTAVLSVFRNNKTEVNIHILSNGIKDNNKRELENLSENHLQRCFFYDISNIREKIGPLEVKTIALSSYARLFLSEILPNSIEKVIYMDCDSLILSSLSELWNNDLGNYCIAGVVDVVDSKFKTLLDIPLEYDYVNAGMIVFNLRKIRSEGYLEKITSFLHTFQGEIPHHDQGVINFMFHKSCKILHPKFNCMTPFFYWNSDQISKFYKTSKYYSDEVLKEAIEKPVFMHFTPFFITRPWVENCEHPYSEVYLKYFNEIKSNQTITDKRNLKFKILLFLYKNLPFATFTKFIHLSSKVLSRHRV